MYKPGDKFIIELEDKYVNPEDSYDDTKVWKIKRLRNFMIEEHNLRELGKFDEEVWIHTLDDLRDTVNELKEENKRLKEENRLKAELIEKLEGEGERSEK